MHLQFAVVTQPVKSLRTFARVDLMVGGSKVINFYIDDQSLSYYSIDNKCASASSLCDIMVAPNAERLQTVIF